MCRNNPPPLGGMLRILAALVLRLAVATIQCAGVAGAWQICRGPSCEGAEVTEDTEGSRLRTSKNRNTRWEGAYGLQILVEEADDFKPAALRGEQGKRYTGKGMAFVELKRGQRFAVKLANNSQHDAAVALTIDGLNVFEFSKDRGPRHFLIPSQRSIIVEGWRRTARRSDSFVIDRYSRHPEARLLHNPDEVGTITAVFRAAWSSPDQMPVDEQGRLLETDNSLEPAAVEVQDEELRSVKRHLGRTRAIVNVRYPKTAGIVQPNLLDTGRGGNEHCR